MKQALNPTELAGLIPSSSSLASGPKRVLVDSYIMMKRSKEEVDLLEREMESTQHHYTKKIQAIDSTVAMLSKRDDKYAKGAVALLLKLRVEASEQLLHCTQLFALQPAIHFEENDSESETESDICSSSDDDSSDL